MADDFVWRDAGRTVVLRRDALPAARGLLSEHGFDGGFELLSTRRALADAGELGAGAATIHDVPAGPVAGAAAELLPEVGEQCLVALGGGRVIDAAKAVAAVTGARVAAVPTTMSGAEMTGFHRLPAGAEERVRGMVRPELVLVDPRLMTSAPEAELRASSMNALGHGADSLYTPLANPVSVAMALRGAQLIAAALDAGPADRDRSDLALGSILCGYAIDSALFAIHHVICQTLVAICGTPHAQTNAAVLPRTMEAMVPRAPRQMADLAASLGTDATGLPGRLLELGGHPAGLGEAGADRERLEEALDGIEARPQLGDMPDPPGREELRRIIDAAW